MAGWVPLARRVAFKFKLYIAKGTRNSAQALANLRALCFARLPNRHSIEVIDVLEEPKRASADHVFMTPTLVKVIPDPVVAIVGTLADPLAVSAALGLDPAPLADEPRPAAHAPH